jgi:hypothetical protein
MRIFVLFLAGLMLGGCAGHQRTTDAYEQATVERMVDNNVSSTILARTIVRVNGRRETRYVTALTNQTVTLATNVALNYLTNQTVTVSSNLIQTLATNEVPATTVAGVVSVNTNNADADAPPPMVVTASPGPTTNVAVTTANNLTISKAGNQTVTTASLQVQRSQQVTATTNNLSVTTADNYNLSVETNVVVTVLTNTSLTAVTNVAVVLTNLPVYEYFLELEYTPPLDFTLQAGESLVLVVDGVRHGLTQTSTPFVLIPPKGYNLVLYRVPAQLLVDIANARVVKLRIKGTGAVIERKMSQSSRNNFKKFLVKYFRPDVIVTTVEPTPVPPPPPAEPLYQPVPGPSNPPRLPNS